MNDYSARLNAALVGRYQVERELGRGGMATVYLARDLRHERLVALKVLHPELASALGPERFLREIRTVARLQHPHILSVHDSGEAAGLLWFTMPFVEGESLRDRLRREHQLPLDVAVRVAHEAARALDYAHRHGVIHRDIKPENILLTSDGDTLVADFGIGRAVGAGDPEDRETETGVVVGTPAYMSPEQGAGERELDGRTDVYSLGVVLYEMLAGEPPFTAPTAQAILARRFTEAPRPIHTVRDTVPQELEQIVMRALARLPADRFATAGSFVEALDTAWRSTGRGFTAAPTGSSPARVGAGRKKWVAGFLGALLAVVLLVLLIRSRAGANPELDSAFIAVTPFDVLDSRFGLWREGMVDLLSRNLDGAGPLRTVSPTVVVRRWSGRADPQSAADLGRRTGAGLALYGSLLAAGRDSARMRVTLLDVQQKRPVEEWDLLDLADRIDRLGDSLTVRVLQGLGRTRPIGSVRRAGFGSTSLPAIKAFLQGEQHLRRSEWDSALGYYERAVRLDSTFPQALRRVSTTLGWIRTGFDSLSIAYALRAGAHNRGLPPRDSLMTASDSLLASLFQYGLLALRADSGWGSRLQRLFSTLQQATSSYSDDPEPWFLLGEAEAHYGAYAGHSPQRQLHAFDRVIALDPDFAPAYIHPIETLAAEGPAEMQRYLRPYLALNPQDVNADGIRFVQAVLSSPGDSNLTRQIAEVPGDGLFAAYLAVLRLADSAETALQIARIMKSRTWPEPPLDDSIVAQRQLERSLLSRGHLGEWRRVTQSSAPQMFSEAALLGGVPADSAAAAFRGRLSGPVGPLMVMAFPWWTQRRDTTSLRIAAIRADSMARSPRSSNPQLGIYVAAAAEAYLALARGDSALALRQFLALPHARCPACQLDRLTAAQLLVERKLDREAWPLLQSAFPSAVLPSAILWALLRGRVAERIGERDRAIRSYAWVTGMWRNADPELQPYVAEAREGLARLTAEPK